MTQDLRATVQDLQRKLATVEATLARERVELTTVRAVLGPLSVSTGTAVQELLNYALAARRVQSALVDSIKMLQASQDPEAKALGNSMDALFRTTPVPQVLVNR